MSSTIFARGSRCSCFSSASRLVLQPRCPKLSPLLLLGLWLLFCAVCDIFSRLVCLDARLFEPPVPGASIGKVALLSVSGESDAPLGSWAATQLTTFSVDRYPAASLQQLRQVEGEVPTHKEHEDDEKNGRRAKDRRRGRGGEKKHWLAAFTPTSLQQLDIFHDDSGHSRNQKQHPQQHGQLQQNTSSWQRRGGLLQQQHPQHEGRHPAPSFQQQERPPLQQKEKTYFQKLLPTFRDEQEPQTSGSAAYIQSVERAATQQEQQHHQGQQRERLLQRAKERPATYHSESFLATLHNSTRRHREVESRQSRADIRPVSHSGEGPDDGAVESKQMRSRGALLETQGTYNEGVELSKRALLAPGYHPTLMGTNGETALPAAQDGARALGKGGEGEILLETRGKSRGIGTILAGAGLSTLLGGLSQYQQGPLAAGPPGSAVPALGAPAVTPGVVPAVAPAVAPAGVAPAAVAAAMPAAVPGADMSQIAAMGAPQESSGHNVLPITVGIILGLVLMCLIGGCIFRKMKKKRRR